MGVIDEAMLVNEDKRMLKEELELIWAHISDVWKGGKTLEIGAYKGMTSYLFGALHDTLKSSNKHYIVDIFETGVEDWDWKYEPHTVDMMKANLGKYLKYCEIIKSRSLEFPVIEMIGRNQFDCVFLDGDHRFPTVYLELCMVDLSCEHIFGHDYGHNGVTESVDKFCEARGYKVEKWRQNLGLFEIVKK